MICKGIENPFGVYDSCVVFMENLMQGLNEEQLSAVTHQDGPLLIVAGAGTGKTTVITQRIAYMIEQGWAKSDEILALTFTEKAAEEMSERVDRLLPIGYLDLWISTFHGFGEKILREHGLDIGLPADFKLLNEFEQYALVKKNLDKFDLDYYRPMGNPTKFIRALIKHFSRAKDEDINPAQYLDYAHELRQDLDNMLSGSKKKKGRNFQFSIFNFQNEDGEFDKVIAEQEVLRINEVANAYHVYQQLLLDNSALDFGDLINYTIKLFRERPAILEKYRQQFKYILLDEFQDTNWAQYELIKMLVGKKQNLVVVGDDDQSIYKFRGASVSNILQFEKDFPNAKQIFLNHNYRNTQNILDLSYEFIKLNDPNRLEFQLSLKHKNIKTLKQKLSKKLIANNNGEGVIEVLEGKDLDDEIRLVIEKIADLKIQDRTAKWNDFAILVRANDSAREFINALEIAGLPYQFLSSRGLYTKPVIMDIISYFKLLDNYHESSALYRVLNLPFFNFTYHELVNFNYWAHKKAWSLYEILKSVGALKLGAVIQKKTEKVLSLVEKHSALAREKSTQEIFVSFLNDSGYLQYLIDLGEERNREALACLNQFLKRIKTFEASSDDKSVKAFLAELQMELDAGEEGSLPIDPESGPEAIKIMTVHASKGLEFKYVFITNMVDKRFPTIERHDPIAIPDDLVKEILPEGDIHLEEERRLLYVAMTRAKEHLYFSWSSDYGGTRKKKPSRFLGELGLGNQELGIRNQDVPDFPMSVARREFSIRKSPSSPIPNPQSPIPSFFSYTQIAAFSNCPYQYRFAHILKIPCHGKAVFSFGKTMHSTLQKLFALIIEKKGLGQNSLFNSTEGDSPTRRVARIQLEEILKLYDESWIDDWYESKEDKKKYREKGRQIIKDFYEKHKDNWPNAVMLEKGFNYKIPVGKEYYTIRGNIDRVDEDNGKLKIVDYKTGGAKDKLSFDEKAQLLIYQIAVEEVFRQPVEKLAYYYLENNSEVEFVAKPDDLVKVKEKISEVITEIKKGEFSPRPSELCKFCDFKDICEFRKK